MSVPGIEAIGSVGSAMPAMPAMPSLNDLSGTTSAVMAGGATDAASAAGAAQGVQGVTQSAHGAEFGNLLSDGIDRLEGLQNTSSNLAVKAATGDSDSIQQYTIAATEASTATSLAVSLRNSGVQAFNQIMSMQV